MTETTASRSPHGQRLERLNVLWRVAGPEPIGGSLPHRLLFTVRRMIAAALRPQETFNAAVVDYINATAAERQRIDDLIEAVDESLRFREALAARERRLEAGMSAMRAAHDELRLSVGVLHEATQMLKHQLGRIAAGGASRAEAVPVAAQSTEPSDALGHKYVGFEDQFRGSAEAIRQRLLEYVPIFTGASDVLDVGCGRGEFLTLLREHGVSARGIDTNEAMVQRCRDKGLDAEAVDALAFLRAQPARSLGGLFAAQVVEHLQPSYLAALLDAAFHALRSGAPIVLETINPACWFAFFESYVRDITHVRPLHPDTLQYLLMATGFERLEIRYRAPYPEHEKLQRIAPNTALAESVETLNGNVEKINRLLFTHLDYAAVGFRPSSSRQPTAGNGQ
jgi:SAM-dependent methyltransferase/tetrahydromethanopterin S-methyltransferase subunit F